MRALLLFLLTASASAQTPQLTRLGSAAAPNATDVWGYVGPDGREYAVVEASGLRIFDVSGSAPVQVSHVWGGNSGSDIEVLGHYAYVTDNVGPVEVFDIADPANPVRVRTFDGHPDDPSKGVHTLHIADGFLYLNGNVLGLSIWSLANPADPVYVGAYRPEYVHDIHVRNDTLYAALIGGGGIDIVDVSDKSAPVRMANVNYPGSGAHNVCMTESGSHIFVGDEVGTGRWTRVFDVRNVQDVELVNEIIVDRDATVHNCHVRGNLLYIAHYELGVRVVDITDPTAPQEIASYVTPTSNSWTAWPYLPSGKILVSEFGTTLTVLRLDGFVSDEPGAPVAEALRVSPNPASGPVRIAFEAGPEARLSVHDLLGREIARLDASGGTATWDARVPAGVYVVRLTTERGVESVRLSVVR